MIMLRNRSRAVTSKPGLMADHSSQPCNSHSQTQNDNNKRSKTPTFLTSPRFKAFTQKNPSSENDGLVSPTSILDVKPFFSLTNPFKTQTPTSPKITFQGNKHHAWNENPTEPKGIGLVLNDDSLDQSDVIVVTNGLRVQIPPLLSEPTEFGAKTSRASHVNGTCVPSGMSRDLARVDRHSEDYTCVISHGPIPRTTHIFGDCVVQTYCCLSSDRYDNYNYNCYDNNNNNNDCGGNNYYYDNRKPKSCGDFNFMPQSFLSFCHTCKKNLQQKVDIYIYRGEKAFCSRECRYREMVLDGMGNEEIDDENISHRGCF